MRTTQQQSYDPDSLLFVFVPSTFQARGEIELRFSILARARVRAATTSTTTRVWVLAVLVVILLYTMIVVGMLMRNARLHS